MARILAAAQLIATRRGTDVRVALAAPTGKAATRMRSAVTKQVGEMEAHGLVTPELAVRLASVEPSTIHRLLVGVRGTTDSPDAVSHLPFDLVIVDETSMVSLPLMAGCSQHSRPPPGSSSWATRSSWRASSRGR